MIAEPFIRRFAPADAAATHDVFFQSVRVGAADHYREKDLIDWAPSSEMPDGWGEWLDSHITVVAEKDGTICGFFMLEATGYLNMAFVRPDYRRTGLADRLYEAILAEARARNMPRMTAWASRLFRRFLTRKGWKEDNDPPPLAGHPVPTDDAEPIDFAMRLVL
jgi:putative acetyltransferase